MSEAREAVIDGTRDRILDAALDLFGERGPAAATVRDIAGRAGVNIAAISYHFGGKDELYRAVAESVATRVGTRIRQRVGALLADAPAEPESALAALEALLDAVVEVIVGPPEMRRVARFIIREQMQPTAAFEILYAQMSGLHTAACRLFATAAGVEAEAPETRMRVFLLIGQAIFLRMAEAAVLRRMGLTEYDEDFLAAVKAMLRQHLRAAVAIARDAPR